MTVESMTKQEAWQYLSSWVITGWGEFLSGEAAHDEEAELLEQAEAALMSPDTRLQAIADAWSKPPLLATATGRYPDRKTLLQSQWPELAAAIEDALTEEDTDKHRRKR